MKWQRLSLKMWESGRGVSLHCCVNAFYSVKVNHFLQIAYTEDYEHQRGKGSFPAMITPGYYLAKKAQENASDVSTDTGGLLSAIHLEFNTVQSLGLAVVGHRLYQQAATSV